MRRKFYKKKRITFRKKRFFRKKRIPRNLTPNSIYVTVSLPYQLVTTDTSVVQDIFTGYNPTLQSYQNATSYNQWDGYSALYDQFKPVYLKLQYQPYHPFDGPSGLPYAPLFIVNDYDDCYNLITANAEAMQTRPHRLVNVFKPWTHIWRVPQAPPELSLSVGGWLNPQTPPQVYMTNNLLPSIKIYWDCSANGTYASGSSIGVIYMTLSLMFRKQRSS
nr:MAG: capsid protein [Cressdnaviricota sp.]